MNSAKYPTRRPGFDTSSRHMWDLWWMKWRLGMYSANTHVSFVSSPSINCFIFIYHRNYIFSVLTVSLDTKLKSKKLLSSSLWNFLKHSLIFSPVVTSVNLSFRSRVRTVCPYLIFSKFPPLHNMYDRHDKKKRQNMTFLVSQWNLQRLRSVINNPMSRTKDPWTLVTEL